MQRITKITRVGFSGRFLLSLFLLSACAGCASTFGTIERVTQYGTVVAAEQAAISVIREGEGVDPEDRATLKAGDVIRTGEDTSAVVRLESGETLILRPETEVALNYPTFNVQSGAGFIEAAGESAVVTSLGVASVTARRQNFSFQRYGGEVSIVALTSGHLSVTMSNSTPVNLQGGQRVSISGGTHDIRSLGFDEYNDIAAWVNAIEYPRGMVPAITGLGGGAAEDAIRGVGFTPLVSPVPVVPEEEDIVQRQSPGMGRLSSRSVTMFIGAESVAVPDVAGLGFGAIADYLESNRLRVGAISEHLVEGLDVAIVTSSNPGTGELALPGASIALNVSVPASRVPDLIHYDEYDANIVLQQRRLRGVVDGVMHVGSVNQGAVAAQDPRPNTLVRVDSAVRMVLSAGPLPPPYLESPGWGAALPNSYNDYWRFSWSGHPEATSYQLQVYHPNWGTLLDQTTDYTLFDFPVGQGIDDNALNGWYWRVRGYANGEWGLWSNQQTFNVVPRPPPLPPALTSPAYNGLQPNANGNWVFDWDDSPGVSTYELVVWNDSTGERPIYSQVNASYYTFQSSVIPDSGLNGWRWQVRGYNGRWGDWSEQRPFVVQQYPPPPAPGLLSPYSNALLPNTPGVWDFQWQPVNNAQQYQLQVWGPNAQNPLVNATISGTRYSHSLGSGYIANHLLNGWSWRVRTFDGKWGEWSQPSYFNVRAR